MIGAIFDAGRQMDSDFASRKASKTLEWGLRKNAVDGTIDPVLTWSSLVHTRHPILIISSLLASRLASGSDSTYSRLVAQLLMPYKEGKAWVTGDARFPKDGTERLLAHLYGNIAPPHASARNAAGILPGTQGLRTKRG